MVDRPIDWSPKERITADKLNSMIDYTTTAITTASDAATTVRGYDTRLSNLQSNIDSVSTVANRADSNANTANTAIDNAKGNFGSLSAKLSDMTTAAERYASEVANQALINARNYTTNQVETTKTYIEDTIGAEVQNARLDRTMNTTYNTLAKHMDYIDAKIKDAIATKTQVDDARGAGSLNERFN